MVDHPDRDSAADHDDERRRHDHARGVAYRDRLTQEPVHTALDRPGPFHSGHITPPAASAVASCRRGLACQLQLDLLASVKLLTEFTTLAASVATAATWAAEGLDGSALTAVWSASTDVLTAVV